MILEFIIFAMLCTFLIATMTLVINELKEDIKTQRKKYLSWGDDLLERLAFAGKNYIEKTNSLKDKIQIQADNIVELNAKCKRYKLRIKKLKSKLCTN